MERSGTQTKRKPDRHPPRRSKPEGNAAVRPWGWFVLVLLVVGGFFGFTAMNQGRGGESTEPPIALPAPPTPLEEERTRLHIAVSGTDNRLVQAERGPEGWTLGVEAKAQDVDLVRLLDSAHTLFTELARTRAPIAQVIAVFRTDALKDVYGHQLKDVVIARIRLEKETFERINWHGFDPRNFPRVADELWLHDLLMQQLASLQQQQASQNQAGQGGSAGGSSQGGDSEGGGSGGGRS